MGSKVATSLWKDEGWYLWHVCIGSSICACVHPRARCLCAHVVNMYMPSEWVIPPQRKICNVLICLVTESWLVRSLGWLLLNLDCKSPYLHVQLAIQIRFRILPLLTFRLSSHWPLSFCLSSEAYIFADVSGLNCTIGGGSTVKLRRRGKKEEPGHVWPRGQLWFYEMRAEARAQVDNAKPGIAACLNFKTQL